MRFLTDLRLVMALGLTLSFSLVRAESIPLYQQQVDSAQPDQEAVEVQSDSLARLESGANEQTPTLNSGSTEAGMLARMERKRKRAEEAAAATGIPLVQSESVMVSEVSLAKSESTESEQTLSPNSGSTEAGMLARMERKRKRAEAAANQPTADKSPDSEEPK